MADLTPEQIAAQLEQYTKVLDDLKQQQGGLSESSQVSIAKIKTFVDELVTANTKLTEITEKLKAAKATAQTGMDVDKANVERLNLQLEKQRELAAQYNSNAAAVDNLAKKTSQAFDRLNADQERQFENTRRNQQATVGNYKAQGKSLLDGIANTGRGVKALREAFEGLDSKAKEGLALGAIFGGLDPVMASILKIQKLPMILGDVQAAFNKSTFQVDNFASSFIPAISNQDVFQQKYGDFAAELEESGGLFGSGVLTTEQYQSALMAVTEGTARFTANLQRQNKGQTAALTSLVALLQRTGVEASDTIGIFNTLNSGLDMNVGDVVQFKQELVGLGRSLGIGNRIFKGAAATLDNLQGFSNNAGESFKRLAIEAAAAGMSTDELANFAASFDDFDTAARSVQGLNAVLGETVFDFTEIQQTPIEDRLQLIRDRLQEAGISFNDLSFRQKRAFAEFMPGGKSVADLGKLLSQNTAELTERQLALADSTAISADSLTDQVMAAKTAGEALAEGPQALALGMDPSLLTDTVRKGMLDTEKAIREMVLGGKGELEDLDPVARITAVTAATAGLSKVLKDLRGGKLIEAGTSLGFLALLAEPQTAETIQKTMEYFTGFYNEITAGGTKPASPGAAPTAPPQAQSPAPGNTTSQVNSSKMEQARATNAPEKQLAQVTLNHTTVLDGDVVEKSVKKFTPTVEQLQGGLDRRYNQKMLT